MFYEISINLISLDKMNNILQNILSVTHTHTHTHTYIYIHIYIYIYIYICVCVCVCVLKIRIMFYKISINLINFDKMNDILKNTPSVGLCHRFLNH